MTQYNKLVRDRIPGMIRSAGEIPVTRILSDAEYFTCLEMKLDEEVQEFRKEKTLEELADILEVLYALADCIGCSKDELHRACDQKRSERGGFDGRVFLISKE